MSPAAMYSFAFATAFRYPSFEVRADRDVALVAVMSGGISIGARSSASIAANFFDGFMILLLRAESCDSSTSRFEMMWI